MDVHLSGSPEELARQYELSLKEALANLDRIVAEAKASQAEAIDEMQATKETRKKIEASAETIAREVLEARKTQMEHEIRAQLEKEVIKKLCIAGRSDEEIGSWLDIPNETVSHIRAQIHPPMNIEYKATLDIIESGRGGTILFQQGENILTFHWEFGGGKTLALIFVPDERRWEAQTGLSLKDRMPILEWVARQVISRKAEGHVYTIQDDVIEIV